MPERDRPAADRHNLSPRRLALARRTDPESDGFHITKPPPEFPEHHQPLGKTSCLPELLECIGNDVGRKVVTWRKYDFAHRMNLGNLPTVASASHPLVKAVEKPEADEGPDGQGYPCPYPNLL